MPCERLVLHAATKEYISVGLIAVFTTFSKWDSLLLYHNGLAKNSVYYKVLAFNLSCAEALIA